LKNTEKEEEKIGLHMKEIILDFLREISKYFERRRSEKI